MTILFFFPACDPNLHFRCASIYKGVLHHMEKEFFLVLYEYFSVVFIIE